MNERNQELIVDLIGGRLSQDEERTALARIKADPGLRAEYEAQMSVVSMLGASSTPSMTPEERSTLHAALRQHLRLADAPVPVAAVPPRWRRWWAPIGGLAVAAAVVIGAVVVLPGALSGDESDGAFDIASAEIATTVPSTSLTEDIATVTEDEGTGDNSAGAAAPEATESAPEEEASADAETQAVDTYDAAIAATSLPYLADVDLDALESELASDPESLRNGISAPSTKSLELDTPLMEACLDTLRAADTTSSFSPIATTTYEGTVAVVISVSPSEGDPFLTVFAVASCVKLASTEG